MKLKPLTTGQRNGWYFASFIFGVSVMVMPRQITPELFRDLHGSNLFVTFGILVICWLIGVVGLRFYVQQIENTTNFTSIVGAGRNARPSIVTVIALWGLCLFTTYIVGWQLITKGSLNWMALVVAIASAFGAGYFMARRR